MNKNSFQVIIVGGSYAGLAAALSLGRMLKSVLIIDSGLPCNRFSAHSHNFITQDGEPPGLIYEKARKEVLQYDNVKLLQGKAVSASKQGEEFEVMIESGERFLGQKLLLASGVRDIMPTVPGAAECWGVSMLHCPYCHGYELKEKKIGVWGNGPMIVEFSKIIYSLSKDLMIFTDGPSTIPAEVAAKVLSKGVLICEKEIAEIEQDNGQIQSLIFKDGTKHLLDAIFTKPKFEQNTRIHLDLGLEMTEQGWIKIDTSQKTSVSGVFAAGDNTTYFRQVSVATAAGTVAGVSINIELSSTNFDYDVAHPNPKI